MANPNILIFTSKTGGGHVSLAEAMRDMLGASYNVEILDPQPVWVLLHYRLVCRHALWLWRKEFELFDTPRRAAWVQDNYNTVFARKLDKVLAARKPEMIVSTYPFLTYAVMESLKRIGHRAPLVSLFSDPNGVHNVWLVEKRAAATFTVTRENYERASHVLDPARLHLSGWVVRGQFYKTYDRASVLSRAGFDPARFTIFLQGGGEGAAKFTQTVESIRAAKEPPQVILAAGTNKALLERFSNLPNIYPLPFTKEIAQYMAAADVVVGKAGPNMLFEAVTLNKSFVATAYIPGQEEANLEFIRRHKLGWVALDGATQKALIEQLMANPAMLQEMNATVDAYRRWNNDALGVIVPTIEKLLKPR